MHPQPEPVRALALLLKEELKPTELEITVIHVEEDMNDGDDEDGAVKDHEASYPSNAFIKVGVHLGLNSSDLPRLARDFQREYKSLRALFRAENYCTHIRSEVGTDLDEKNWRPLLMRVMDATTCLLLVCPDNSTAWADRRRAGLILSADNNQESFYREEIKYLNLLFTQHSKAPSSWAYRKWVCRRLIEHSSKSKGVFETDVQWNTFFEWIKEEVHVCTAVAEKFPKNYYSWTHRSFAAKLAYQTWCTSISATKAIANNNVGSLLLYNFLGGEVKSIEPWLKRHVSDHSAAHYGAEALKLLLTFGLRDDGHRGDTAMHVHEWGLSLVRGMLTSSRTLFENFEAHEVIWIWRRLCACLFLKVIDGTLKQGEVTKLSPSDKISIKDFIDNEVICLTENFTEQLQSGNCCFNDDEKRLARRYSAMYVLWIVHQVKRCRCKGDVLILFEAQECIKNVARILNDDSTSGIKIGGYLSELTKSVKT